MDKRIVLFTIALGLVVCMPLFGYWKYQGTTTYNRPLGWYRAPDHSFGLQWQTGGSANGNPWNLDLSGWVFGDCWVLLSPERGSSRIAWVWSESSARSNYTWIEDGTAKAIDMDISIQISEFNLSYNGSARGSLGGYGGSSCSSGSQNEASAGGYMYKEPYGEERSLCATGSGSGSASSITGGWASNSYDGGLLCDRNEADGGLDPEVPYHYPPCGWYWGSLSLYGMIEDSLEFTDSDLADCRNFSVLGEVTWRVTKLG